MNCLTAIMRARMRSTERWAAKCRPIRRETTGHIGSAHKYIIRAFGAEKTPNARIIFA